MKFILWGQTTREWKQGKPSGLLSYSMPFPSPGRPPILTASPLCIWLRTFSEIQFWIFNCLWEIATWSINIISNSVHTKLNSSSPPHILVSISTPMSVNYNTLLPLYSILNRFYPSPLSHISRLSQENLSYFNSIMSLLFPIYTVGSSYWTVSRVACFPFSGFRHRQGSDYSLHSSEKPSMAAHFSPLGIVVFPTCYISLYSGKVSFPNGHAVS